MSPQQAFIKLWSAWEYLLHAPNFGETSDARKLLASAWLQVIAAYHLDEYPAGEIDGLKDRYRYIARLERGAA